MKKQLFAFTLLIVTCCLACYPSKPRTAYEECAIPSSPDYALLDFWAAHPEKLDSADRVPDDRLTDGQFQAKADVFYIHPTTYTGKWGQNKWNAPVDNLELNVDTDEGAVRNQASIFNECYRIFAPRYRQAHFQSYKSLEHHQKDAKKAFETAYSDVKKAFNYYMDNYNDGRPILIVGHSQGTTHGVQLLQEFFDGKKLQSQLVAAYLVGLPVYQQDFTSIENCEGSQDNQCVASWRTMRWGHYPKYHDEIKNEEVMCINPVSWSTVDSTVPSEAHLGMVLLNFYDGYTASASETKIAEGVVWIDRPKFPGSFLYVTPDYHQGDYNLFYMNVRENACERLDHFLND